MRAEHPILGQLQPEPLDPGQIVTGRPRTSELTLAVSEDGVETAGFWSCARGTFTDVEVEESFLVISGRATVHYDDGREYELVPGTVHRFGGGERTTWVVEETVLKAFWIAE